MWGTTEIVASGKGSCAVILGGKTIFVVFLPRACGVGFKVGKISFLNVELFLGLYLLTSQLCAVWRV